MADAELGSASRGELVTAERAQGRPVFVYAVYAERHDVVGRLTEILSAQGLRAEALRASVTPEGRKEWLERRSARGRGPRREPCPGPDGTGLCGIPLGGCLDSELDEARESQILPFYGSE